MAMTCVKTVLLFFVTAALARSTAGCNSPSPPPKNASPSPTSNTQPAARCEAFPVNTSCQFLSYNCTSSLETYNRTVAPHVANLNAIIPMLLDGNCNCRNLSVELFCRTVLPECSVNGQQQCSETVLSNSTPFLPCRQYCQAVFNNCLANAPEMLLKIVPQILGSSTLHNICDILPNETSNCWSRTYNFTECTGQRPTTTQAQTTTMPLYTTVYTTGSQLPLGTNNGNTQIIIIAVCVCGGVLLIVIVTVIALKLCRKKRLKSSEENRHSVDVTQETTPGDDGDQKRVVYNVLYKSGGNEMDRRDGVYEDLNQKESNAAKMEGNYTAAGDVSLVKRQLQHGDLYTQVNK